MIQHSNRKPEEYQRVIDSIKKPQPENLCAHAIVTAIQILTLSI